MGYYFYDFLLLIGVLITGLASMGVQSAYKKYSRVLSRYGVTAEEMAERILRDAGIYDVRIERVSGNLTDHYDPSAKVLRLSDSVYGSRSMAAIGVAAHECGHAIQDDVNYGPLLARRYMVPFANICSKFSMTIIVLGLVIGLSGLFDFGILLFCGIIAFQLVTLPVEFDASRRACTILSATGNFSSDEMKGVKKVLTAAAMTYIAAAANSILQLVRLLGMANRDRRR